MGVPYIPTEPWAAAVLLLFYLPHLLSSTWLSPYDPCQTRDMGFQDACLVCVVLTTPPAATLREAMLICCPLERSAVSLSPRRLLGFCSGYLFPWSHQAFDLGHIKALSISKVQ